VPFAVEHVAGDAHADGPVAADEPLRLTYRVRCPSVGRVRFEGLRLQTADLQGFFTHSGFVPGPVVLRVLPVLTDAEGHSPTAKRHNLLPPPGVHRLRRPGSGSELLDLRDYLPGDPPKTIAWKVSARRDRLITKEFESEVPLRCTLFVDTSNSVRVGPPGKNALARLVAVGSAAAQANTASRDLTGLCLFDEHGTTALLRPARTARHLVGLLNVLAEAGGLAPTTGKAPLLDLLPVAYAFAQEVYPHLLRPEVNRVPFWLPWLWPLPAEVARPRGAGWHAGAWLLWLLALVPFAAITVLLALSADLTYRVVEPLLSVPFPVPPEALLAAEVLGLLLIYPVILLVVRGWLTQFVSVTRRRHTRWRKQLAAIMSVRHGLAPGGLAALMEDDEQCSLHLQRFLAEHDVPYPLPLYDERGRYLFAAPGKVEVLARALSAAVGKGHDNELFVLLADLLELDGQLTPLLRAVKVALARHHQVVVLCPWPPGVPPPAPGGATAAPLRPPASASAAALLPVLGEVDTRRYHDAFHRLRQTFARMGVQVVCAAGGEPVRLILDRLDRMRMLGRRR
jgi:hypothetical protein